VLGADRDDDAAQPREVRPRLAHGAADARPHLDLAAQELRADLAAAQFRAAREQARRRVVGEVAAARVDQQVLLLDADRERRFAQAHRRASGEST
jgi:hypothetical protein